MRIKNLNELSNFGAHAKKQIQEAIADGGLPNQSRLTSVPFKFRTPENHIPLEAPPKPKSLKKKPKPSRVMKLDDGRRYCPWPSTDPFVTVHQLLEKRFGRFSEGGMLVTEMIIEGGEKSWRFDFALIPPLVDRMLLHDGKHQHVSDSFVLIEADGFGFHKTLDDFKNDRAKQTHAIKHGFVVMRITNEDVKERVNKIVPDVEVMLNYKRLYNSTYVITPKGFTQSVFTWK